MYLIIIYDVQVKKCTKIHKYLKKKMHWVQNSVFEGEITESQRVIMQKELKKLINPKEDSIIIYDLYSKKWVDRQILGIEKNKVENII